MGWRIHAPYQITVNKVHNWAIYTDDNESLVFGESSGSGQRVLFVLPCTYCMFQLKIVKPNKKTMIKK